MGVGCLYGRRELLEALPPWQGGGEMISSVTLEGFSPNELPWKFEAGTPNVEGAVGLETALAYLVGSGPGLGRILDCVPGRVRDTRALRRYRAYGSTARRDIRAGVFPFTLEGVHAHDLAAFRTGAAWPCARASIAPIPFPIGSAFLPAAARASPPTPPRPMRTP
jgi:selenocysteine lyase/cysteine desulfurase